MSTFPSDLKYTHDHEWLRAQGTAWRVGITQFAVDQLGDITLVDLPREGDQVTKGQRFGTIESVKSVSDLYAAASAVSRRCPQARVAPQRPKASWPCGAPCPGCSASSRRLSASSRTRTTSSPPRSKSASPRAPHPTHSSTSNARLGCGWTSCSR